MDQSLDDYVKENKITGRGGGGRGRGARGRGRGGRGGARGGSKGGRSNSGFYNQGTAGGGAPKRGGGAKRGLMPNRTTPRGGTRGRGRGRGGTSGRIQKRAGNGQMQSQSQQAAKKRLLQAKKTLQLAIQEATKVTKITSGRGRGRGAPRGGNARGGARKFDKSSFGTQRTTQRSNFNTRYLDRLDAVPRQSYRGGKQTSSRPSFYNRGSNSDRVVSSRGRRGRGRGRY